MRQTTRYSGCPLLVVINCHFIKCTDIQFILVQLSRTSTEHSLKIQEAIGEVSACTFIFIEGATCENWPPVKGNMKSQKVEGQHITTVIVMQWYLAYR